MQDNSQENNNFDTIMSGWRRLSREQIESSGILSVSGDSSGLPTFKKEEDTMPVMEKLKGPIATAASAGTTIAAVDPVQDKETNTNEVDRPDDKEEKFIRRDNDENKESGCDVTDREEKEHKSFLEDDSVTGKSEKAMEEKIDSTYLHSPLPYKGRSNASTINDEEDCGIKCLYYTLQCCDCVLM